MKQILPFLLPLIALSLLCWQFAALTDSAAESVDAPSEVSAAEPFGIATAAALPSMEPVTLGPERLADSAAPEEAEASSFIEESAEESAEESSDLAASASEAEAVETVEPSAEIASAEEADEEIPPETFEWTFAEPEALGVSSAALDAMFSQMNSGVRSAVVVKNGTIIGDYFADGYDETSVFTLQSVSKSITSTLVGIAIDQGYIGSVDDYAADYLPALAESGYPEMRQITIRHLLTHTSGLVCTENSPEWDNWRSSADWIAYLVSRPMTASPGSYFEYSTGNIHIISAILETATGMSLIDFANEALFAPLGITSATLDIDENLVYQTEQSSYDITSFLTDPAGVGDGGNGYSMTAYDLARIGLLYLQEGEWMGQQLVSADYIRAATTTQAVRSSDGAQYGFCWWTDRSFGDAGYTGYFAQGHFGQFVFVVPEIELVVVFTGMLEYYTASQYRSYVDTLINGM